jgi:DNA-binding transcriptional LysR family regulator
MAVLAEDIQLMHVDPSDISGDSGLRLEIPRVWRLSHLGAKLAFLRAGFGFGVLPLHLVEADLASGTLVEITTEDAPCAGRLIEMWAVYRTDSPPGPAGRSFIERLRQCRGHYAAEEQVARIRAVPTAAPGETSRVA